VTVVCDHCHSILDAQDPRLTILQKFTAAVDEDPPLIPLGTRGKIRGTDYEAVGFQRRTIHVDGIPYSWHEYVLFNPYKGFRYLTEYNGHWNDTSILRSLPTVNNDVSPATVSYLGETYKHFQTAKAGTSFVLGEFPWQVRVGESSDVSDYVSPPRVISSERTGKEVTWSMGEYISGRDIWKAFGLQGEPPERIGVYENQPSPLSAETTAIWVAFGGFMVVLFVMMILFWSFARSEQVVEGNYANRMVHKISRRGKGFSVLAGDTEYQTEFIIFAAPTFLASYLVEGMAPLHDFEYSPWLTANLTLEQFPDSYGTDPTWDNVFMESPTLGYVDATHQSVRSHVERTVWTFYWALADGLPSENRQLLLNKDWNYWKEAILHDLERVHHDIRKCVSRIDIMRMGHAMARPKVGAIFSAERRNLAKAHGRILFANSDLSGFSIFEEAQYRGVNAADRVLSQVARAQGPTH